MPNVRYAAVVWFEVERSPVTSIWARRASIAAMS
jgi:hypothetical protein